MLHTPCDEMKDVLVHNRNINASRPEQNGKHFPCDIFKIISLYENCFNEVPATNVTDDWSTLVQVVTCCRQTTCFYLNPCRPRQQWVNITLYEETTCLNMTTDIVRNVTHVERIMHFACFLAQACLTGIINATIPTDITFCCVQCGNVPLVNSNMQFIILTYVDTGCENIWRQHAFVYSPRDDKFRNSITKSLSDFAMTFYCYRYFPGSHVF